MRPIFTRRARHVLKELQRISKSELRMTKRYTLGPFSLDAEAGVLMNAGVPVPLGPRAVAVLTALVDRARDYVEKGVILGVAWPGVVVEESNLAVQISTIRRALSGAPGGERWIETLPRRGYRFVGPVSALEEPGSEPQSGGRPGSNLPAQTTSFIGRARDLADVEGLLSRVRLLTLTGAGGIGKTRLATQVAAELTGDFADGVWLVELASTSDPALVTSRVAEALGVAETRAQPLFETLCARIRNRRLLLLLDNCEHLRDACAALADGVLTASKHVTILATSREPLGVPGEQVHPVPALSVPDSAENSWASSEALQLFIARAAAANPRFHAAADAVGIAASICRRIDGIPLAIEMAASRAAQLGVAAVADKLEASFRLASLGWRTPVARHQTLRATLDWSYGLLSVPEQSMLQQLAVFRGGFSLDGVFAVAGIARSEARTAALLRRLVACSLVAEERCVGPARGEPTRFRMLEPTREYALEKLSVAGDSPETERRHATFFRDRMDTAASQWPTMPDRAWLDTYAPDIENVRAALRWAHDDEARAGIVVALAGTSGVLWTAMSMVRERRTHLEMALPKVTPETPPCDLARLLREAASVWGSSGDPQAVDAAQRAVELQRRLADRWGLLYALSELACNLAFTGRFEDGARALKEASALLVDADPPKVRNCYFGSLGFVKALEDDPVAARAAYEESLRLCRAAGAESSALGVIASLAYLCWVTGDLDAALDRCQEAIAVIRAAPIRYMRELGMSLCYLMGIHTERGEYEPAWAAGREALELLRDTTGAWQMLDDFALLAARSGKLVSAARIAGFTDATYGARHATRPPNLARARTRVQALLDEGMPAEEQAGLFAEGAAMSEEDACEAARG
jgi:predicted ATPase/DNA-binding winged helix-turn-helix (wHTH) protein